MTDDDLAELERIGIDPKLIAQIRATRRWHNAYIWMGIASAAALAMASLIFKVIREGKIWGWW